MGPYVGVTGRSRPARMWHHPFQAHKTRYAKNIFHVYKERTTNKKKLTAKTAVIWQGIIYNIVPTNRSNCTIWEKWKSDGVTKKTAIYLFHLRVWNLVCHQFSKNGNTTDRRNTTQLCVWVLCCAVLWSQERRVISLRDSLSFSTVFSSFVPRAQPPAELRWHS